MENIIVSVLMVTYGHELYIEKAIDSVLSQQCNFKFELIIANDCSPDNTDRVIRSFLQNHPKKDLVKYICNTANLGIVKNFALAASNCDGKYIGICEGDDFWIDKLKLQRQVDFLEENDNYSLITHNALKVYEGSTQEDEHFIKNAISGDLTIRDILDKWSIPTASMLFRSSVIKNLPEWIVEIYSFDFTLTLLCANKGRIYFLKDVMSVYRLIYNGTSASSFYKNKVLFVFEQQIKLLNYFNNYSNKRFNHHIEKKIKFLQNEMKFYSFKTKSLALALLCMPKLFAKKTFNKLYQIF